MFTQLSVSMGSVSMRLTNRGLKTVEKNCINSEHARFPCVAVPAVQCIKYCSHRRGCTLVCLYAIPFYLLILSIGGGPETNTL